MPLVPGMPLVSVVIATFRRPEALLRAVNTVLRQTMPDLEVIVVVEKDDLVTLPVLTAVRDTRLRSVVNPEKKGPGMARDAGVFAATGRWVAFLDDDDEWFPQKLEKQLAAISGDENLISTTLSKVVTPEGTFIRPADPYTGAEPIDEWLFGRRSWFKSGQSMLQTSSLMVPRVLFERLRFGEIRHEEWELAIRAVKLRGYRLITVLEPLVIYYAGNTRYPWRSSVSWVNSMRGVISPRAYSGFCLTVATQGVAPQERNLAFYTFFTMALRHGRPTPRQLFAFLFIWLFPDSLRHRIRARLPK